MTGIRPQRFQALPVGQGDAFLLRRRSGEIILVDGGKARDTFAALLGNFGRPTRIDVAVCTHADADHANGLLGLLESNHFRVSEVWLPGRWTQRLAELCEGPYEFVHELYDDIKKSEAENLESVETPTERPRNSDKREEADPQAAGDVTSEMLTVALEHADEDLDALPGPHSIWPYRWAPFNRSDGHRASLWVEALATAARIRDIALAAHHHGSTLRWFDFEQFALSGTPLGGKPFLLPVNSIELAARWKTRRTTALQYLALSVANRQSLVFVAPETEHDSGVLFSADSDLRFSLSPLKASRGFIATAPHHGSESNAAAYDAVSEAIPGVRVSWVRSDGRYITRPGPRFLAEDVRACTLCRATAATKQAVKMIDTKEGWSFAAGQTRCVCT